LRDTLGTNHVDTVERFELTSIYFRYQKTRLRHFTPNGLRGAIGAALKRMGGGVYERYFAPRSLAGQGPSGFADPPRPFVLRPASPFDVKMHLFLTCVESVSVFTRVMAELGEIQSPPVIHPVAIDLAPSARALDRVRIRFVTPTELKGVDRPEFGALMSRIRDRVSILRSLYGTGPLPINFRSFGDRAAAVRMTRCALDRVEASRTSRKTGQTHSLGGFTGVAEYEGELGEFIPFLEAARWTGVGRQTVWGKGEISFEEM